MTFIDDHGRPYPPLAADETTMLIAFLDYQRATLQWKTAGLGAEGLRAQLAPTSMTLGGLLKHMAWVEDYWFSRQLIGNEPAGPWADIDWKSNPDWEWKSAAVDSPGQLRSLWSESMTRSREFVAEALRENGLDRVAARPWFDGNTPTLRWILCHMIEEYARHNGHADLLRESVDGETGE